MSVISIQWLVEECGLVAVESFEDGAHECFPNEAAAIGHSVPIAEALQRMLFAFVEQDGDTMCTGLLLHCGGRLEH